MRQASASLTGRPIFFHFREYHVDAECDLAGAYCVAKAGQTSIFVDLFGFFGSFVKPILYL